MDEPSPINKPARPDFFKRGLTAFKKEDYLAAITFFLKSYDSTPANQVDFYLGLCQLRCDNYDQAIQFLSNVLLIEPSNLDELMARDVVKPRFAMRTISSDAKLPDLINLSFSEFILTILISAY
jgi:tetratricopeptide (TPR) repeat protein